MTASVVGARSARLRMVGAVFGVRQVAPNTSSACRGGLDDVVGREGRAVPELGEEIAAQQRLGGLLVENPGLPAVRDMGGVDVTDPVMAELDDLTVGERHRRAVGQVVERHHAAERPMRDLGLGRRGQQIVHGAALVGFDVAEGDPAQAVDRDRSWRWPRTTSGNGVLGAPCGTAGAARRR